MKGMDNKPVKNKENCELIPENSNYLEETVRAAIESNTISPKWQCI